MTGKSALLILLATWLSAVFASAWAASFDIGGTEVAGPEPAGFVEVTPKMLQIWQLVQAGQGDNRIVAFYIPQKEEGAALTGKDVDLSRNISVQVRRSFQGASLTEADFQRVRKQIESLISTRQVDAEQAKVLEQFNGNLQKAMGVNLSLAQAKNLTLPAHINRPGHFSYSEISTMQAAMPDGSTQQEEVTSTAAAVLVKGKFLMFFAAGSKGDLEWTRSAARKWVEAIVSENKP